MTYQEAVNLWKTDKIGGERSFSDIFTSFAILFSYNSAKLENDNVTFEGMKEIFETGSYSGPCKDANAVIMMANASEGWDLLMEKMGEQEKLSENLIKDFHLALNAGTYDDELLSKDEEEGFYKKNDNEMGSFPEDVPFEMNRLLEEINSANKEKAIISASYLQGQFEAVQPFAEGNGVTARLLLNYILLLNDHPPVVIFEEDRGDYYDALASWEDEDELKPIIDFLKEETVKTWETILK